MKQKTEAVLLTEIVESLNQAAGACSQLIHANQDPRFMGMRHTVDMTKEFCLNHATFQAVKRTVKKVN